MTNNQLTGRALDEACAKAMGYTISRSEESFGLAEQFVGEGERVLLKNYSRSVVHQIEMDTFLMSRGHWDVLHRPDNVFIARHWVNRQEPPTHSEGSTLSEALARLVVAVGEQPR